jgi:hypothetical protein
MENKKQQYLNRIEAEHRKKNVLRREYQEKTAAINKTIAGIIEEGKLEADLTVIDVARHLDVERQTINKILVKVFGPRHPDKVAAAKRGHENRHKEVVSG